MEVFKIVERLRLFIGANELTYSDATITRTNTTIIDTATAEILSNVNAVANAVIDFRKNDGTTSVYQANIQNIKRTSIWNLKLMGRGWELMNKRVEQVYDNQSPEAIVEDVINNFTSNLTYASTGASGITIIKYVAKAYPIDIINDMATILGWQIRIDENDNFYFEEPGFLNNGKIFTNGEEIQITSWEEDPKTVINRVRVVGGFENINTQEVEVTTSTTFSLDHKPQGSFKATVSGIEVDPDTYTVNAEDQQVVFDSSKVNPTFDYSYDRPIIVDYQDDDSITDHDEIFKQITVPFLNNRADVRKYAKDFISVNKDPRVIVKALRQTLDFTLDPNEIINVIDDLRSEDELLVINKIVYDVKTSSTKLSLGSKRDFVIGDWQSEVMERVKKLERQNINEEDIIFNRLIASEFKVSVTETITFEQASPVDSLIRGHPTLGRRRTNLNFEADCSGNSNSGTWTGTGIGGSQYTTSGNRLSAGQFNGSDRVITVSNTINSVLGVSFFIKATSFTSDILQLTGSAKISVDGSGDITTTGLSSVVIRVDGVVATRITAGVYSLVSVTFSSINATAIKLGSSSSFFDGDLDEIFFFDGAQVVADDTLLTNKDYFDSSNAFQFSVTPLGYWAMDNCKRGDRIGARTPVV